MWLLQKECASINRSNVSDLAKLLALQWVKTFFPHPSSMFSLFALFLLLPLFFLSSCCSFPSSVCSVFMLAPFPHLPFLSETGAFLPQTQWSKTGRATCEGMSLLDLPLVLLPFLVRVGLAAEGWKWPVGYFQIFKELK